MRHSILTAIPLVFFTVVNSEPCNLKQPTCPKIVGTEYDLTLLPVIMDCSKYIMCQRGTAIIRPCPANLIFNVELKVCDFPDRTECIQCVVDEQPDSSTTSTTTAFSTTTTVTSTTADTTNAIGITSDTTLGTITIGTTADTIGTTTDTAVGTTIGNTTDVSFTPEFLSTETSDVPAL